MCAAKVLVTADVVRAVALAANPAAPRHATTAVVADRRLKTTVARVMGQTVAAGANLAGEYALVWARVRECPLRVVAI
jgi:hypothetical protein